MLTYSELFDQARIFLDKGGVTLWAILALSLLLWILILERYWYIRFDLPALLNQLESRWQSCRHRKQRYCHRLRASLLEELRYSSERHLRSIEVLTQVLPLLGLLGTVSGMIETFDVIAIFGNGNARGLAGGISQALLTTMSGLVTALSGFYFGANLKQRIHLVQVKVESTLE